MGEFLKLDNRSNHQIDAVVKQWQNVAREAPGLFLDTAEEVAQYFLHELRRAADEASPEWADAAQEIFVSRSQKGVGFVLPFEAFDLEYGHPEAGITAKPVLRQTISRQSQGATKRRFSNLLHDRLWRRD